MSTNRNIYTASSQQWRLIDPNRPAGMPPLVPTHLVEKEKLKKIVQTTDCSYYYKDQSTHLVEKEKRKKIVQTADCSYYYKDQSKKSVESDGSYYYDRFNNNKSNKFTAQQRLPNYKKKNELLVVLSFSFIFVNLFKK